MGYLGFFKFIPLFIFSSYLSFISYQYKAVTLIADLHKTRLENGKTTDIKSTLHTTTYCHHMLVLERIIATIKTLDLIEFFQSSIIENEWEMKNI